MTYNEIAKQIEQLTYRDKLRLGQLLLQLARKEEEEQNPEKRVTAASPGPSDPELVQYVAERLKKLRLSNKEAVLNSIGAMFQFCLPQMVKQLGGKVRSTQSASDGAGVQVRFMDATEAGRNLGIVGVGGAAPPQEAVDADEEEYFRIYAEAGMKPVDLARDRAEVRRVLGEGKEEGIDPTMWCHGISTGEPMTEETLRIRTRSLDEEVDACFDDSSRSDPTAVVPPRFVLVCGTPVSGKTRLRRDKFTQGFVTVDAGDIFRRLEQGAIVDFPGEFEWMLDLIGPMVTERAIAERRHIVTEVFGCDPDETTALLNLMKAVDYTTELAFVRGSAEQAELWNRSRDPDNVSSYYTDRFNVRWLTDAARAHADTAGET